MQSNSQSRGIKIYGGQAVKAGGIIVRQVGSTWHDGSNTSLGKDFTLFSLIDGVVVYDKKKVRPAVSKTERGKPLRKTEGGGGDPLHVTALKTLSRRTAILLTILMSQPCIHFCVSHGRTHDKPQVHVYPLDHAKAIAVIEATHTKKPKEGVPSRQERRRAMYKPRAAAAVESTISVAQVSAAITP